MLSDSQADSGGFDSLHPLHKDIVDVVRYPSSSSVPDVTDSPAHHAVEMEDLPRLRELLDAGADIEDGGSSAFTLLRHAIDVEVDGATQTGTALHVDTTALLLARGADPLAGGAVDLAAEAEARGHWLAAELIRAWQHSRPV